MPMRTELSFSKQVALAASFALLAATPVAAQQLPVSIIYQNGYDAGWIEDAGQAEHFQDFMDESYYGAFVIGDDNYSYWYAGFHELETARNAALSWCESENPRNGDPCHVAAFLVPTNIPENFVSNLSEGAVDEYLEYLTYGDYKAFAVSPNGAYAYTWNYETQELADINALDLCEETASDSYGWEIGMSHECYIYSEFIGEFGMLEDTPNTPQSSLQKGDKK